MVENSSLALEPVKSEFGPFQDKDQGNFIRSSTRNVKSLNLRLTVRKIFSCFRKLIIGYETFTSEGGLVITGNC